MDRRNTARNSRLILADGRNTARVVRLAPPSDRIIRAEWYTCQPDNIAFEILTWDYDPGDEFTNPHVDVTFTEGDPDWTGYIFGATLVSFTFDGFEGTLTTPAYVAERTSTSAKLEFTKAESDPEDPSNGTGGEFVVNGAALTLNAAGLGSTEYPYASPPAKFRFRDTETIMEDGIEIKEPSLCMITGYDRWVAAYGSGVAGTHILQFDINADTESEQSVQLAAASYTISSGRFEAQAMSPAFTAGAGEVLNTGRLRVTYGGFYPADVQVIAVRLVVAPLAGY